MKILSNMKGKTLLNTTIFFHGDMLLLPDGTPDSIDSIPAQLPDYLFPQECLADKFEIPALDYGGGTDIEGAAISVVSVDPAAQIPPGWRTVPVRHMLSLACTTTEAANRSIIGNDAANNGEVSVGDFALLNPRFRQMLRAFHIAQWRGDSRFCGSCGAKNTDAFDELARVCPVCSHREYPRIAPAVITLIEKDQHEILLAHNRSFQKGIYSLIAGFNEAGESLEETVVREIWEEVHVTVTDIRYVCSQPWPFPHSLMAGFYARGNSGEIRPDGVEIEDAGWFDKNHLPKLPAPGSVSRLLIEKWVEGAMIN
jgi:NAD+ diphosphatase